MYVEYKSRRLPVSWYLSSSPERDLADAATFTSARRDPGAVESKVCKSPAEFLTPDTWFSLHRCRLRIKTHRTHCSHRRHSTVSKVSDGISSCKRSRLVLMQSSAMKMMIPFGKLASISILVAMALVRHQCLLQQLRSKRLSVSARSAKRRRTSSYTSILKMSASKSVVVYAGRGHFCSARVRCRAHVHA